LQTLSLALCSVTGPVLLEPFCIESTKMARWPSWHQRRLLLRVACGILAICSRSYNRIMSSSTSITWHYLAANPKSRYKQLFVKGTRIRARVLHGMFMSAAEPMTPAEIAAAFNLPLAAVQEAIVYCRSNPPEIAKDFEREERLMEASGMNDPEYKCGGRFKVVTPEEVARILKS
jgi:uncharacterized protein (DUF433 family)